MTERLNQNPHMRRGGRRGEGGKVGHGEDDVLGIFEKENYSNFEGGCDLKLTKETPRERKRKEISSGTSSGAPAGQTSIGSKKEILEDGRLGRNSSDNNAKRGEPDRRAKI